MKRSTRHPILQAHAKSLRADITFAEKQLWEILRNRRLGGWKFRRQHVVEPYIVDFCCVEKKLIVEIDGTTHDERTTEDRTRDDYLTQCGFVVLRFWNEDVKYRENFVVQEIVKACRAENKASQPGDRPSPPTPLPRGERGADERGHRPSPPTPLPREERGAR